jgi:hypothetical protein
MREWLAREGVAGFDVVGSLAKNQKIGYQDLPRVTKAYQRLPENGDVLPEYGFEEGAGTSTSASTSRARGRRRRGATKFATKFATKV